MNISKNIRYLRKINNMSQDDLATKFGYKSYTTIQKWESGDSEPPIGIVNDLATFFHVNIDDIVKKDLEHPSIAPVENLSSHEKQLISAYRVASDGIKDSVNILLNIKKGD